MNKYTVKFKKCYGDHHTAQTNIFIKDFEESEEFSNEIALVLARAIKKIFGENHSLYMESGIGKIQRADYLSCYGQIVKSGGSCVTGRVDVTITKI